MNRLDFVLDDFTRIQWAPEAQSIWAARVHRINRAFRQIEVESVLRGLRRASLQMATPDELISLGQHVAEYPDYCVIPLQMQGTTQTYSATVTNYIPGQPFAYRVAVTDRRFSRIWARWNKPYSTQLGEINLDDAAVGDMLGYPTCCTEFFRKQWVDNKMLDLTWPAALSRVRVSDGNLVEVTPTLHANIILRWLGVRFIFHMPCSFSCEESVKLGENHEALGRLLGFNEEMNWIREMLSWPVEWTALHGIAIITTPVCKIITRTDATADKYIVQIQGTEYPREGARGIVFPFRDDQPIITTQVWRRNLWEDNGFSSLEAMTLAHEPILKVLSLIPQADDVDVVDFGCGNCELLRKVRSQFPWVTSAWGVDSSFEVIARRTTSMANVTVQNIRDFNTPVWKGQHDVALISIARLSESTPVSRALLLEMLSKRFKHIVFYAYTDTSWPVEHIGSAGLGEMVGDSTNAHCYAMLVKSNGNSGELQDNGENQDANPGAALDS